MRIGLTLAFLIGTALPALASEGFNVVIPGRAGVPVVINGVDASYAVVEGEGGLGKGNFNQPTVYGGRPLEPEPPVGHYYPTLGHTPGYGRLEIEPPKNRVLPKPAESYHESWSAQSAPPKAQPEVPFYPPPVIAAPSEGGGISQQLPNLPPTGESRTPRPRRPGPRPN
jgi:hypothetical protein